MVLEKSGTADKHGMTKLYTINSQFFYNVDNEATLYILGWFFVRGCISRNNLVRLQVRDCDGYILEKMKAAMEYTGPLFYNRKNNSVLMSITSKEVAGVLRSYSNQPGSCKPFLNSPHFFRGLFDARGTITIHKTKYLNLSIISHENIAQNIREFLKDKAKLAISTKHYYKCSYTDTLQILITKTTDAVKLCEFMYDCTPTFYLARKLNKYRNFVGKSV